MVRRDPGSCSGAFAMPQDRADNAGINPPFGEEIDCVERRIGWGDDLLFYQDRLSYVKALARRWISVETEAPFLVAYAG